MAENKELVWVGVRLRLGLVCTDKRGMMNCRRIPPNINRKMHWGAKYQSNEAWKEEVWGAVMQNRRQFPPSLPLKGRPKIIITLFQIKEMDYDNLFSSAKVLVDALKGMVIIDDKPSNIELLVNQIHVNHRNDERVEIEIKWQTI